MEVPGEEEVRGIQGTAEGRLQLGGFGCGRHLANTASFKTKDTTLAIRAYTCSVSYGRADGARFVVEFWDSSGLGHWGAGEGLENHEVREHTEEDVTQVLNIAFTASARLLLSLGAPRLIPRSASANLKRGRRIDLRC